MAVIVNSNEQIDSALKRLQREIVREKILEVYRSKQFRVKKSLAAIEKRRGWKKTKRRRRAASRRAGK